MIREIFLVCISFFTGTIVGHYFGVIRSAKLHAMALVGMCRARPNGKEIAAEYNNQLLKLMAKGKPLG